MLLQRMATPSELLPVDTVLDLGCEEEEDLGGLEAEAMINGLPLASDALECRDDLGECLRLVCQEFDPIVTGGGRGGSGGGGDGDGGGDTGTRSVR